MGRAAWGAVLTATLLLAAPAPAHAATSSWFAGDYDVLLGYGCTTFELEPFDARFGCPAGYRVHEAIDFDTPIGTPVFAGWPGTVMTVGGRETHDYGPNYILMRLDEGHDILLGHLSRAFVVAGQKLKVGDPIGLTGDLGECNWPNLHFEARVHGGTTYQSLDPSAYLLPAPAQPVAAVHDAPVVTVEGDAPPVLPVAALLMSMYLLAWRWRRARRR